MTLTSRPSLLFSIIAWLLVSLLGIYFVVNIKKYVNFGLDLVGGTYITLKVEFDKVIRSELEDISQLLIKQLKSEQLEAAESSRIDQDNIILTFKTAEAAQATTKLVATYNENMKNMRSPKMVNATQEGNMLTLSFTSQALKAIKKEAIEGNMHVLRTRLNATGLAEVTIAAQGEKYIVVEIPSDKDIEQAKAKIGKTALLELKPVYDKASSKEQLLEQQGGEIPEGTVIVPGKAGEKEVDKFYLVPINAEVTGRSLKDAHYQSDPEEVLKKHSAHTVTFTLKPEAEERFYDLTSRNVGGAIAIIIDNVVIGAPGVHEPIRLQGNAAKITGNYEKAEAQDLASMLKSGAFVAPVSFAEERHIGPSLGAESIRKGLLSCIIGLVLLFLFSVIVYKTAGLFAFIVLVYNLILILFGLIALHATLTLPGIAGMVLTIGMAIDASILIYERIKEELATGTPMRKAVDVGFAGATAVILDANITHFIVSVVLYWLGTGPIKGFAVTMIIGIISTLITGLLLLKTIFKVSFDVFGVQRIRI